MTQVKMFFKSASQLEEAVQKWLEARRGIPGEVVSVTQCEHTDPATNVRGVLLTILYRTS